MILVGGGFDWRKVVKAGIEIDIDGDRKAQLFDDGQQFLICLHNGQREMRIPLTREAAEAVFVLLGEVVATPASGGPRDGN